ncbi:MAG: hypothetical protein HZC45_06260 [Deltaproteobacteria bacterium]|nr:hypothetical protein [Deltaproteobacteria bacterium]
MFVNIARCIIVCAGAFVDGLLEKEYKDIGKEFIWQWFFPAKTLTLVPEAGEYRRYHLR